MLLQRSTYRPRVHNIEGVASTWSRGGIWGHIHIHIHTRTYTYTHTHTYRSIGEHEVHLLSLPSPLLLTSFLSLFSLTLSCLPLPFSLSLFSRWVEKKGLTEKTKKHAAPGGGGEFLRRLLCSGDDDDDDDHLWRIPKGAWGGWHPS